MNNNNASPAWPNRSETEESSESLGKEVDPTFYGIKHDDGGAYHTDSEGRPLYTKRFDSVGKLFLFLATPYMEQDLEDQVRRDGNVDFRGVPYTYQARQYYFLVSEVVSGGKKYLVGLDGEDFIFEDPAGPEIEIGENDEYDSEKVREAILKQASK